MKTEITAWNAQFDGDTFSYNVTFDVRIVAPLERLKDDAVLKRKEFASIIGEELVAALNTVYRARQDSIKTTDTPTEK